MSKDQFPQVRQAPVRAFEPSAASRLAPPRTSGRIVGRDRIVKQLLDGRRKRCVVIHGQAGCGKTTTAAAWRQALLALDFGVAWLTLTADDNDLTRWLDDLLASIASIDPRLTNDAAPLAGRGIDDEAVERTIIALIRSIAAASRDVAL